MEPKKQTIIFVLIAVISTAGIVAGVTYVIMAPTPEGEVDALEIYHWWTSGGEAAAITALVDEFITLYPDTTVQQVQIAGGGGFEMRVKIKTLMLAGQPPDTFQIHNGYEWKIFYDAGLLDNIDNIWTTELKAAVPDVVEDISKGPDGHYYSVPVNIHRSNVMWYNAKVLQYNAIDPATLTTWPAFWAACDKLIANGTSGITNPVAMGEQWTAAHAFEQVLASVGIDTYEAWINGDIDSVSATHYADLLTACEIYENLTDYINSDWAVLSWDSAIAKLIGASPTAAFSIMGDWANGEFFQAGWTHGVEYDTIGVPGTGNMYGLVVDCFEKPKNIPHPTNVNRWLAVVASKDGQDAFNPLKGSISARTDANVTKYGPYQTSAITDFNAIDISPTSYMFPSVVHGSGAPEAFNSDFIPLIGALTSGAATATATATAIAALASTYASDFIKVWSL
ncbi:MAG: carbohydrate ABC transporter substrate-binding protein [Candidatus Lokiarchaeota archaeon]|nr:carbohydrate ABC transporter substrate-binding protein [Candidatus Lokiarchaeota archaeon]